MKDMTRPDAMCSGEEVNLAAIEDKREAIYGEKEMNVTYTDLSLRRHELKLGGHGDQFECGLMEPAGNRLNVFIQVKLASPSGSGSDLIIPT